MRIKAILFIGLFSSSMVCAEPFTGFSVGAHLGGVKNSGKIDSDWTIKTKMRNMVFQRSLQYRDRDSSTNKAVGVSVEYGFPITHNIILSSGVAYGLNNLEIGEIPYFGQLKSKTRGAAYINVGYKLQNSVLVYGKLSYHVAKLYSNQRENLFQQSLNNHGMGFGAGVSYAMTTHMAVGLETEYVKYTKRDFKIGNENISRASALCTGQLSSASFMLTTRYYF